MDDASSDALHPAIRGLKTICRCNNIKYRTIERAIRVVGEEEMTKKLELYLKPS
jgi:hypothetical protein